MTATCHLFTLSYQNKVVWMLRTWGEKWELLEPTVTSWRRQSWFEWD
jgi:hypothetical protein